MEEKLKTLSKIFSCLPPALIRGTLYRDDVNGDTEIASQRLQKLQGMENLRGMFPTSVGGKGPTVTGQEKESRAADFREEEKKGRFANHDEMSKEQKEVKELTTDSLTTDSSGDYSLGETDSYQNNGGQNARPSGVFGGGPRGVLREGPRGGFSQGQSNLHNQGPKENDMGVSQGGGVGQGHPPKQKTKYRGRGRGRGMGRGRDHSTWQAGAKEQSQFQQNQLLVSGLSALTTEDCLVNFIEAMSDEKVENVTRRNDKALITMANDITGTSSTEV